MAGQEELPPDLAPLNVPSSGGHKERRRKNYTPRKRRRQPVKPRHGRKKRTKKKLQIGYGKRKSRSLHFTLGKVGGKRRRSAKKPKRKKTTSGRKKKSGKRKKRS